MVGCAAFTRVYAASPSARWSLGDVSVEVYQHRLADFGLEDLRECVPGGLPEKPNWGKDVSMKIDEIRNLRDAVNFQPFALHLADGRAIPVRHRDFLMTSPSGRTVIVYQPDDSFDVVDVMLITSLRVKSLNGRSRRKHQ